MCYPAPGPRCSAHARTELKAAAKEYKADPKNYAKFEALQEAQREMDSTPDGQDYLNDQIAMMDQDSAIEGDFSHSDHPAAVRLRKEREELNNRLQQGYQRRINKMDKLKIHRARQTPALGARYSKEDLVQVASKGNLPSSAEADVSIDHGSTNGKSHTYTYRTKVDFKNNEVIARGINGKDIKLYSKEWNNYTPHNFRRLAFVE